MYQVKVKCYVLSLSTFFQLEETSITDISKSICPRVTNFGMHTHTYGIYSGMKYGVDQKSFDIQIKR